MAALHELVGPGSIRLDVDAADWRSAIRAAGELLVADGTAASSYTDSMIRNVEEHGPYIVVAPGFAFAHARAGNDVERTGMSWIRLAEPVEFDHASNDPVGLIAALAAPDSSAHLQAMRQLATLLGNSEARAALDKAATPEQFHAALRDGAPRTATTSSTTSSTSSSAVATDGARDDDGGRAAPSSSTSADKRTKATTKDHILTVCGNGLGTSLFLKNTLEKVLDRWGWSPYLTVEATDTISARGKSKDADLILTSGEIARTLGDVGIPVKVISNFTSTDEVDAALRDSYDI